VTEQKLKEIIHGSFRFGVGSWSSLPVAIVNAVCRHTGFAVKGYGWTEAENKANDQVTAILDYVLVPALLKAINEEKNKA
jgi:hypothetical protein